MKVDVSQLTLGELRELRRLTGKSLVAGDGLDEDALVHVVWLLARRERPDVTLEEIEALRVSELEIVAGDDGATVPFGGDQPTSS